MPFRIKVDFDFNRSLLQGRRGPTDRIDWGIKHSSFLTKPFVEQMSLTTDFELDTDVLHLIYIVNWDILMWIPENAFKCHQSTQPW